MLEKWLSRKLIAFLVTTLLLIGDIIDIQTWKWITIVFMGANVGEHFANTLKKK